MSISVLSEMFFVLKKYYHLFLLSLTVTMLRSDLQRKQTRSFASAGQSIWKPDNIFFENLPATLLCTMPAVPSSACLGGKRSVSFGISPSSRLHVVCNTLLFKHAAPISVLQVLHLQELSKCISFPQPPSWLPLSHPPTHSHSSWVSKSTTGLHPSTLHMTLNTHIIY